MSKFNFSLADWEVDKINDLMREETKRVDREEALKEGLEQGIGQGIIQVIKNMLKKNMPLEDISSITDKSIQEIKQIREEIDFNN